MRTVGLIVEYNPFHNGHAYHLRQSRALADADAVVAVMSGHFLQRGEPALTDKWARTEMALAGGCDLVIELPVAYATQAAEWFAYGAVSLLEATGVVDAFCFGTESGNLAPLKLAADLLANEPAAFKDLLKHNLEQGSSYPGAYSEAVSSYLHQQGHLDISGFSFDQPNHTLALHYLLALKRIHGTMEPLTIAREKAQYRDERASDASIASATAIRKLLLNSRNLQEAAAFVPPSTHAVLADRWAKEQCPVNWENFRIALFNAVLTRTPEQLASIHEITEGLEHRIRNSMPQLTEATIEQLLSALKTKRYTHTKLQRALLAILLGHRKSDFTRDKLAAGVQYIRVLGFTERGKLLLRRMRKTASLPILLSAARPPAPYRYLELDTTATAIYMLGVTGSTSASMYRDFRGQPIIGQPSGDSPL
ncbi:nucleotidyltransferase [Paenibacillus chungangensis]|uniref:tRNA(Met) cytidine acetate ligase n=1 Tax=Paenibacillus chungangensis TaxID=696535 RepID=A0ABW3HQ81_9BACL